MVGEVGYDVEERVRGPDVVAERKPASHCW